MLYFIVKLDRQYNILMYYSFLRIKKLFQRLINYFIKAQYIFLRKMNLFTVVYYCQIR